MSRRYLALAALLLALPIQAKDKKPKSSPQDAD